MQRRFVILLLAALGLSTPALAQDKVVLAECGDGGCTCTLTKATVEDVAVLTNTAAPPGAENMVLVLYKGEYIWSTSLPDQLDLAMGGDGKCPIQLFDVIPEDGTWTGSVRVQKITGCLPQVAQMVPPMVNDTGYVKQIAWGGRFHPSKFVLGEGHDQIQWRELSPTQFDGVYPVPANDTLKVTVTSTATLTAPDTAEATLALRIAAAEGVDASALAIIGMKDCRVDAIYDFKRSGP